MTGRFTQGTPNWIDLRTAETAMAQNFYGDLFGWSFTKGATPDYTVCRLGKDTVAGLAQTSDADSQWAPYFASDDVNVTAERIERSGGTVTTSPTPIGDQGNLCLAQDSIGATFGVWQGLEYPGVQLWGEPGSGAWIELNTPDGNIADEFYRHVFGYQQRQVGYGDTIDYSVWSLDDNDVAGRLEFPGNPPHWSVFFEVADCASAIHSVRELGGEITEEPQDSKYGRFCVAADPAGATFALISPAEIATAPSEAAV